MNNEHKLDEIVDNLRKIGEYLVPLNYPKNDPSLENDIAILKSANISVDGYDLIIKFSKADYTEYILETLQITGRDFIFLPFDVIVKLGRRILGGHELSLVEFFQDNKKIYCWSVSTNDEGKPVPSPYKNKSKKCSYEGFEYIYIEPKELSFY